MRFERSSPVAFRSQKKENPANSKDCRRPLSLHFSSAPGESAALVLPYHRRRRHRHHGRRGTIANAPIEAIVQTSAHDVIALPEKVGVVEVVEEEIVVVVVGTTNVGVEILDFDAQI